MPAQKTKRATTKKRAGRKKAASTRRAGARAATGRAGAKPRSKAKKPLRKGPETEVTPEVLEFIHALDTFKKEKNRPFPTWSEVLDVLRRLGYRKPGGR